jgi:hypothetical protein
MQKCIRLGDEDGALFWATELFLHEAAPHAWSRLVIIASEDVGEVDPLMHLKVTMLRHSWCETPKSEQINGKGRLFFIQAVLMLVHSPKSRKVDHAGIVYCEGERPDREIPDFAKDCHTDAGKKLGRGYEHFFDVGARLANETGDDIYRDRAKKIRMRSTDGLTPGPGPKPNTNLIYEPGGITEFARLALNREVGCVHGCKYCYGPASMHVSREDWTTPRAKDNYLTNLLFTLRKREKQNAPQHQVLMEYSGDCYGDPADTLTGESIKLLHDFGYGVCILTKAPMNAVKDLKLFDPRLDCLGCTITTFYPAEIAAWEPNAPSPQDRLDAVKEFYDAGIYTWLSLEPIINPATSLDVVRQSHEWVDHFKTGKMNVRGVPLPDGYAKHDWTAYTAEFIRLCDSYSSTWYCKHTLWSYLPAGAVNEKFRPMCHG